MPKFAETDWPQILVLYRLLERFEPTPVVALNIAVVRGKVSGPATGLASLDALAGDAQLQRHRPYHIARAITLRELGREDDAEAALRSALACPGNDAESDYLTARITDDG